MTEELVAGGGGLVKRGGNLFEGQKKGKVGAKSSNMGQTNASEKITFIGSCREEGTITKAQST